ncbi:MAG: DUF4268 domain-containing protein [Nitrospirae bacterium]|nr:DUF4268 domain-containing protein [Nitrospirota bacterium]
MNGQALGRLERVDLRKFWEDEAGEFTPWLAQEENMALLCDTIGMELEVEAQEKNVGPFRADILCRDTTTSNWVLIENQLERTDHTHLGQLLTYAAGLDAVTIVWIAAKFTDEHRAAIDWLNKITDERFNFFGLEVELWRIGGSPMAPKFNAVCKPNNWSKPQITTAGTQLQLEYWTALREYILQRNTILKPQNPLPQGWTNYAIGRSNFSLVATVNTRDNRLTAYLVINGTDRIAYFRLLLKDKESIEKEFGELLEWRELPDKKESQIKIALGDVKPQDRQQWSSQHEWLLGKLEKLHRVFSGRVKKLDASEYTVEEGV